MDAVSKPAASARRGLLHRRHPRPEAPPKYNLKYYVNLAKQLEKAGAHCPRHQGHGRRVPETARRARGWSRRSASEIGIPLHFHTHDTSGIAPYLGGWPRWKRERRATARSTPLRSMR
jgi:pyruvate carboxylase